jgi:uridylate kinase
MPDKKTYIISVGGSLIVPHEIDHIFLKKFRLLIRSQIIKNKKFYLVAGGGHTCRKYAQAADKVLKIIPEDLDWLGIHSTRLNAHLLRTIFRKTAHPEIIKNPTIHMDAKEKIIISGGWKPGWSTDYMAAMIAQEYDVKTVINLSNIDYAYDKDPNKFKNAKKITNINWTDFRKIVGDKWIPGLNAPFDPIASKKAQQLGLEVIIMNGNNLINLKNYLDGKKFIGTIIKD